MRSRFAATLMFLIACPRLADAQTTPIWGPSTLGKCSGDGFVAVAAEFLAKPTTETACLGAEKNVMGASAAPIAAR